MNQAIQIGDVIGAAVDTGLFVSTITFQDRTGFGASGAPTGWANVSGLVAIQCMAAPATVTSFGGGREEKMTEETLARNPKHVLLDGYYPAILTRYQALLDGVAHEVVAVDHDSQRTMTRVLVRTADL